MVLQLRVIETLQHFIFYSATQKYLLLWVKVHFLRKKCITSVLELMGSIQTLSEHTQKN